MGHFARSNYRFLPSNQSLANDPMIFELDESDVWNSTARSKSPEILKPSSRILMKTSSPVAVATGRAGGPASLPVNVPDWSKILKDEYRENRRKNSDDDYEEEDAEENGSRIPPHEFLARQMASAGITSFSVHEGLGGPSKGEISAELEMRFGRKLVSRIDWFNFHLNFN